MRKYSKKLMMLFAAATITVLCGCGHAHVWKAATCVEPQTCTVCGETTGETKEHTWVEATCVTPKTCSVCGEMEGEVAGHDFAQATCSAPKTCSVCGETEGESLPHEWTDANFEHPKMCTVCGTTEGGMYILEEADEVKEVRSKCGPYSFVGKGGIVESKFNSSSISYTMHDYSDREAWSVKINSLGYGISEEGRNPLNDYFYSFYTDWSGYESDSIYMIIAAIDYDGNKAGTKKIPVNSFYGVIDKVDFRNYAGGRYCVVLNEATGKVYTVFDKQAEEFVDEADTDIDLTKLNEYEHWDYCDASECYVIKTKADGKTKWGYTDSDGNIIKLYEDASGFIDEGYAVVIEDGQVSVIDTDYNIVLDNIAEGDTAFDCPGGLIGYRNGNDVHYFRIGMSEEIAAISDEMPEETGEGSDGKSNVKNITASGKIDVSAIEITPNDTVTIDEVSKKWAVCEPNSELYSSDGQGFWVCFYDHNGTIILMYQVGWGKTNVMGDTEGTLNASWYDENFDMSSVSGWKIGRTDEYGVTFIAVDGNESNLD